MSQLLDSLNEQQKKAVIHDDGSMLVLAGAGSGKTKVLTTRISWLIQRGVIRPYELLAVTFTNKAAKEMISRISELLAIDVRHMWIGTFHAIALRILSKYHKYANLPSYFQILDSQDQLNLLKRLIRNANLDEEKFVAKDLQRFINCQKELGLRAANLSATGFRQEYWLNLYKEYESFCNKEGLVDFTELLLRSYETIKDNPQILENYHQQFKYILIDEFQDTNHLQYEWIKLLKSQDNSLFAVGDDDQSIYSFRGAQVSHMQLFLRDFAVKEPIRLEQNYRSTGNILSAANSVISQNISRIGKNLWTSNGIGDNIRLYEGYTEEDEAYFVTDEILSLVRQEKIALSEIAILYRSNAQSRILEQNFYNKAIPYKVYGGLRFFDRQEIKHVLHYLRLILNKSDNEAFIRIVNFPARGIGNKTIENLRLIADDKDISLFEACSHLTGKPNLIKFTELIKQIKQTIIDWNLPEIVSHVIEATGLKTHYEQDKKSGYERLENLNELINAVSNFRVPSNENPLNSFLTHAVLESGDGQAEKYEKAIQLMTVHAAKGLEFKAVFIVGLEEGLFPHNNSLDSLENLEEERRLMYVAITRAKERLYLLRACSRTLWGKRQSASLSRFVTEISDELITNVSGISNIGHCNLVDYGLDKTHTKHLDSLADKSLEGKTSRVNIDDKGLTLKIGDVVKHARFGNGKIIHLNNDGRKLSAEIFFINLGKKTLDLNIAKIEKI